MFTISQKFLENLKLCAYWKIVHKNNFDSREKEKRNRVPILVVIYFERITLELGRFTPWNQRFNHINYRIAIRGVAAGSPLDEHVTPSHGVYRDEPETRIGNFIEDSTTRINPVTMGEILSSYLTTRRRSTINVYTH